MKRTTKVKRKAPWTLVKRWAPRGKPAKAAPRAPKRKTRVRPRSTKLASGMNLYRKRAKVYKIENPTCAGPGCRRPTEDVHHTRGRSGKMLLLAEFWKPVCRKCHDWIAANPLDARAVGLLCEKGKWGDPHP